MVLRLVSESYVMVPRLVSESYVMVPRLVSENCDGTAPSLR